MYDLPNAEIVEATLATNSTKEGFEGAFVAVLRLDVEMTVNHPAVDVLDNVLCSAKRLENPSLLESILSVFGSKERTATLLDGKGLPGRRGTEGGARHRTSSTCLRVGDPIYGGEFAVANFLDFAKVVQEVGIDLHSASREGMLRRNQPTRLAGRRSNRNRDFVFRGTSIRDGETARV